MRLISSAVIAFMVLEAFSAVRVLLFSITIYSTVNFLGSYISTYVLNLNKQNRLDTIIAVLYVFLIVKNNYSFI